VPVTAGPLSIAAALALPVLRRALPEVVAGQDGLHRTVRWVHVVDVSKADELLRGGELVLSTGAGAGDDRLTQRRFIRSLAEQNAAGLLIELGYSCKHALPQALIAEADARRLPLVATHRPTRFVDITEAIHGALVDRRLAVLRRACEAGDRLMALVLERRELDELLRELARSLQNPVVLENIAGQLVGYATHMAGEQELLEAHREYHRARIPGVLEGHGWLAVEVNSDGHLWGQVTALELDSPLHAEDRTVLERSAQAVALQLLHEQRGEHLRGGASGTFLVELMHGRLAESEAVQRAAALDFPQQRGRILAGAFGWRSARWEELAASQEGSDPSWTGAGRLLERAANAVGSARATPPSLWRDARHDSLVDLLYGLRRSPELLAFAHDQLGPLFEASDSRSRELLRTLEAYLASSGRKADAARALHVTRQSLYLRLERIQRLLGVDLEDPDVLLALHLAVRALRVTQALSPDERR
jgi:PucR family transcriptional regulator, purine catabolism regulatory protein